MALHETLPLILRFLFLIDLDFLLLIRFVLFDLNIFLSFIFLAYLIYWIKCIHSLALRL